MYQSYFNASSTLSLNLSPLSQIDPPNDAGSESPSKSSPPVSISLFANEKTNAPTQETLSWIDLCAKHISGHLIRKEKKGGPCWSPVTYKPGAKRGADGVDRIYCAVYDIEHHGPISALRDRLDGYAYLAHSTYGHRKDDPRFRIILPLAKPVTSADWPNTWQRLNVWLGGINDPATKDASRIYFLPSHAPGATDHFIVAEEGILLDVAKLPLVADEGKAEKRSTPLALNRKIHIEGIEDSPPEPLNPASGLTRVVDRCQFMKWASTPENQNSVSQPQWMAMVSNACRFEASEAWIHEASGHHDEYSEKETGRLIERCRGFAAPVTCERIREWGFRGCPEGGCKTVTGSVTGAPAGLWMKSQKTPHEGTGCSTTDFHRFGPFEVSDRGVTHTREDKDGLPIVTRVSSRIDIVAQTRDASSLNWGLLINVKDPDGRIHEWAMPRELLSSTNEWRRELHKMGATLESTGNQDLLYNYVITVKPEARALCVLQPGWYRDLFVLPTQTFGPTGGERVVLQSNDSDGSEVFRSNGTLVDWQQNVGHCCVGNSRLSLVVCAALTGPTLNLLGEENGGLHLVGGSSIGKTTAVEVAASVWGPRSKFVRNWRTTSNAVEYVASRHNDTLLILDEISQVNPQEAGEVAYMLGNGRGKGRMSKNGSVQPTTQWRLVFLSTGEQSLAEHMASVNKRTMAGQEVRLVNIPADAGTGLGLFQNTHSSANAQIFATRLKRTTAETFGTVGPAFLQALTHPEIHDDLVRQIRTEAETLATDFAPSGACGQVLRVAKRFALFAAVGETAVRLGILPWPTGEAIAGARTCFQAWIETRGGVGNQEADQAIAQVRRFLELHGESRFTAWDEPGLPIGVGRTINRAGFRRVTDDNRTEFYVLPEAFKTEVCAGLNAGDVATTLRGRGYLVPSSDGKNVRSERLPGIGVKKVYRINPDILSDGTEAEAEAEL